MSTRVFPNQKRYNDPNCQLTTDQLTTFKSKYLSRVSNLRLKALGDNFALKGFKTYATFTGSIITVESRAGLVFHDATLINISDAFSLDLDVAALGDTPIDGCHIGMFTDFKYIENPDLDSQNPLSIKLFHVDSLGTTFTPVGWNSDRCKILLSVVSFTKSGVNVIAADTLTTTLLVDGETMSVGRIAENANTDMINHFADPSYTNYVNSGMRFPRFRREFNFQDSSRL